VKEEDESSPPKGKLFLDATCVPADIKYPTDLNLLNEARKETEALIALLAPPKNLWVTKEGLSL